MRCISLARFHNRNRTDLRGRGLPQVIATSALLSKLHSTTRLPTRYRFKLHKYGLPTYKMMCSPFQIAIVSTKTLFVRKQRRGIRLCICLSFKPFICQTLNTFPFLLQVHKLKKTGQVRVQIDDNINVQKNRIHIYDRANRYLT